MTGIQEKMKVSRLALAAFYQVIYDGNPTDNRTG